MKQYIKPIVKQMAVYNEPLMLTGSIIDGDANQQLSNDYRDFWKCPWGNGALE